MYKLDIIVPIWNAERYINSFFRHVFRQTFTDFKIHVGYDQSDDKTLELLDKQIKDRPGIIELYNIPQRNGQGAARDYVLDNARLEGEYIIFLDVDDLFDEVFISRMVMTAEKYKTDLVMCGLNCFEDGTGRIISTQMRNCPIETVSDVANFTDIAYMNPAVWNKLYRREIFRGIRFGKARDLEDGILLLKLLPRIKTIKIINDVLYHYRVSSDSAQARITPEKFRKCWSYYEEVADYFAKNANQYTPYNDTLELMTFIKCGIGLTHRVAFKDLKNARKYEEYSLKKLDSIVPGWRTNKSLDIMQWRSRGFKANMVAVCAVLYKHKSFSLFIYMYWLYKKVSIKDIRW